ncbi:MAG: DUF502 domain-containing protein [Planctomycetes bacterium]|nr:DUF502 domain-containing protein [Planctomycetota bacterium]
MRRLLKRIWKRGIVSTFLTGFFVILPIAITLAIIGWVGAKLAEMLGTGSLLGRALTWAGLTYFTDNETLAYVLGWTVVILGIWLLGLFVKSTAKNKIEKLFHESLSRIPIISTIYKPVSQVIGLIQNDEQSEMKSMSVVFCSFGQERGGGFLALLASKEIYSFQDRECHIVYIPTSPIPMSGGIVFVPLDAVLPVEMNVDDLMKIYFSLGVLSPQVIPAQYEVSKKNK